VHGRTAAQSYTGESDWDLIARVAGSVPFRCSAAATASSRSRSSSGCGLARERVLVGRGALRNPWIFEQAADLAAGRPARVSPRERGQFLLDYIDMLLTERLRDEAASMGSGTSRPGSSPGAHAPARGHDKWVINKLRALNPGTRRASRTARTCAWR
jgi:tRNA-dihydrouridine synthase